MKEKLIKAVNFYREQYKQDVEKYGEYYWKNKMLTDFGYLNELGLLWSDYWEVEDLLILDEIDNITLAEFIVNNY